MPNLPRPHSRDSHSRASSRQEPRTTRTHSSELRESDHPGEDDPDKTQKGRESQYSGNAVGSAQAQNGQRKTSSSTPMVDLRHIFNNVDPTTTDKHEGKSAQVTGVLTDAIGKARERREAGRRSAENAAAGSSDRVEVEKGENPDVLNVKTNNVAAAPTVNAPDSSDTVAKADQTEKVVRRKPTREKLQEVQEIVQEAIKFLDGMRSECDRMKERQIEDVKKREQMEEQTNGIRADLQMLARTFHLDGGLPPEEAKPAESTPEVA
ncbi:hypothetical protein BC629DRAFT_1440408, partial [Irpex lacteus]